MKRASFNFSNDLLWSLYSRYLLCTCPSQWTSLPCPKSLSLSVSCPFLPMVSHLCTCSLDPASVPQPAVCCGPTYLLCLQAENVFAGMGVLEASELPRQI